jgi:hypothetical protein
VHLLDVVRVVGIITRERRKGSYFSAFRNDAKET